MKLKLQIEKEIDVPKGTVLIRCDNGFVTLARKSGSVVMLFTAETNEVFDYDLLDEIYWDEYSFDEMKKIVKEFGI